MKQSLPQAQPSRPTRGSADAIVRMIRREEAETICKLLKHANSLREAWDLLNMHVRGL